MKTVAFVPIKMNNERLPGKNTKCFSDGTPLVKIVTSKLAALKGDCIDEVYCYCSNPDIKDYLPEGVDFLERPTFLDDKYCKGRAIYEEFVKTVDADVYILCHATAPFTSVDHIRECIEAVKSGKASSAFAGQKHQTFFWKDGKPFNFDSVQPTSYPGYGGFLYRKSYPYVFTKECFDETHARCGLDPYIVECDAAECVDIDNADDFELADAVYTFLKNKGKI